MSFLVRCLLCSAFILVGFAIASGFKFGQWRTFLCGWAFALLSVATANWLFG